jgi:ADP-ribosyl-[dinitrogen reductase] hydrolase
MAGLFAKTRDEISSSGYVVSTLEAALWCVHRTSSFEDAIVLAANLGDDSDTVGAVTGQLAGALYGRAGVRERWLAQLAWRLELDSRIGLLLQARKTSATRATR